MTLDEFMSSVGGGASYNDEGRFTGFNNAPKAKSVRDDYSGPFQGFEDPNQADSYYSGLAQLLGYKGQDPGRFLMGMQGANGNSIGPGAYGGTAAGFENTMDPELVKRFGASGFGVANNDPNIRNWALTQGGVNSGEVLAGQRKASGGGFGLGDAWPVLSMMAAPFAAAAGAGDSVGAFGGGAGATGSSLTSSVGNMWSGLANAAEGMTGAVGAGEALTAGAGTLAGVADGGAMDMMGSAGTGIPGSTTTAGGVMGQTGFSIGAGQTAANAAYGGNAFTDFLKVIGSAFTSTAGANGFGFNPSQILPALTNFLVQKNLAGDQRDAGAAAANRIDPLMQAQRQPFIQNATNLMTQQPGQPGSYSQSPFAQGQMNQLQQQFDNRISKYGPSGTSFINGWMQPAQDIMSKDFFNLFNSNAQAGGLFMQPGQAGNLQFQGDSAAATSTAKSLAGFGSIFNPDQNATRSASTGGQDIFSKFMEGMSGTKFMNQ